MVNVLKDVFGDTKRVSILEELVGNWGEFLTVAEIARMADASEKTTYNHMKELEMIGLLDVKEGRANKYKLKEEDKRALSLAVLDGEEYIRKAEISLKELEKEAHILENYKKSIADVYKSYSSTEALRTVKSPFEVVV